MKKSIFIAVLGMASVVASYGQGQINFSNYYSSSQQTGITFGAGSGALTGLGVGPQISAELFYFAGGGATLTSQLTGLASSITAIGVNGASGPGPLNNVGSASPNGFPGTGVFSGPSPVVPGTPGSTYSFAIFAFGTYQSVAYSGWSPIFDGQTQGSGSPLPNVPNLPVGLQQASFTVVAAPEPTTLALAGLGGLASLVMLRRKNA